MLAKMVHVFVCSVHSIEDEKVRMGPNWNSYGCTSLIEKELFGHRIYFKKTKLRERNKVRKVLREEIIFIQPHALFHIYISVYCIV